ncbi:MAG: hypothetical protein AAFR93_12970 [Pseudomonadota bacterium]
MFTIEHEFDCTVVTLVDEGTARLRGDVTIRIYEDTAVLEQMNPVTDRVHTITLSDTQLRDLAAAMNLPEGTYRRRAPSTGPNRA